MENRKSLVIDNHVFFATENMINLFSRYEKDARMLGIIKEMGVYLGELELRSLLD